MLRLGETYQYQGDVTRWCPSEEGAPSTPIAQGPSYIAVRELARLLGADASVKGAHGDKSGAMSASLDAVRFGHDFAQSDRDFMGGMMGLLAAEIGSMQAQRHVDGLSPAAARAAIRRLETIRSEEITLPRIIRTGQRAWLAHCDDYFTHPQTIPGQETPAARLSIRFRRDALLLRYGKQGLVNRYMAWSDNAIHVASLPYQKQKTRSYGHVPTDACEQVEPLDLARTAKNVAFVEALEDVLLVRLAIQAYRGEHAGAAPPSLQELTRGANPYLHNLPRDPFSPDGQAPLRYNAGRAYSVGKNGVDEGSTRDDIDQTGIHDPDAR